MREFVIDRNWERKKERKRERKKEVEIIDWWQTDEEWEVTKGDKCDKNE